MAEPQASLIEQTVSQLLEKQLDILLTSGLPTPDNPKKIFCPEGRILAYVKISGKITLDALGLTWSPAALKSSNYAGDGVFRLRIDKSADRICTSIKSTISLVVRAGPLELSYLLGQFGASATLKLTIESITASAHFRLRECDRLE